MCISKQKKRGQTLANKSLTFSTIKNLKCKLRKNNYRLWCDDKKSFVVGRKGIDSDLVWVSSARNGTGYLCDFGYK